MNSTSGISVGGSAKERWQLCKAQFDELGKSIQAYRVWLESTLLDSSPGSVVERASLSSDSGSQST